MDPVLVKSQVDRSHRITHWSRSGWLNRSGPPYPQRRRPH